MLHQLVSMDDDAIMMFKIYWGSTGGGSSHYVFVRDCFGNGHYHMVASAESKCNPFAIKRKVFAPVFCRSMQLVTLVTFHLKRKLQKPIFLLGIFETTDKVDSFN